MFCKYNSQLKNNYKLLCNVIYTQILKTYQWALKYECPLIGSQTDGQQTKIGKNVVLVYVPLFTQCMYIYIE